MSPIEAAFQAGQLGALKLARLEAEAKHIAFGDSRFEVPAIWLKLKEIRLLLDLLECDAQDVLIGHMAPDRLEHVFGWAIKDPELIDWIVRNPEKLKAYREAWVEKQE